DYQATIPLAKSWGGGEVASADGLRFIVPLRTLNAGPNPKYFGTGRGIYVTWNRNYSIVTFIMWTRSAFILKSFLETARVFHIITLHDMISDQYSHPYIQIISPHMREAHAALDAILHHETELPIHEMMVDTAGFTE